MSFRHSKFSSMAILSSLPAESPQPESSRQTATGEQASPVEPLIGTQVSLGGFGTVSSPQDAAAAVDREPAQVEPHSSPDYTSTGPSNPNLISAGLPTHSWSVAASPSSGTELNSGQLTTLGPVEGELLHFYVCHAGPWVRTFKKKIKRTQALPKRCKRSLN